MNFHLQTGPGHHHNILISELISRKLSFTFSEYHPTYRFSQCQDGVIKSYSGSKKYDLIKWLVWGISNKLAFLRKNNTHLDCTYTMYDTETKKRISNETGLLFGWAQVSRHTINSVKKKGAITVLDYPIPHILTWQKILHEEAQRVGVKAPRSLFSSAMEKRMLAEIKEVHFISVPSEFVKNSFLENGVSPEKLIFNSYGIDTTFFTPLQNKSEKKKLTVIFVGSVELRKGVHYLLEAFDGIQDSDVELKIVGTVHQDFTEFYDRYRNHKNIFWLGQQNRDETAARMREADVLVMPSLLEGLSLTLLEAMASGTPVISSAHAGGAGLITDYKEGFVVPIRDVDSLRDKIIWCHHNRTTLEEMGSNARQKVLSGYRQQDYADRFIEKIVSLQA